MGQWVKWVNRCDPLSTLTVTSDLSHWPELLTVLQLKIGLAGSRNGSFASSVLVYIQGSSVGTTSRNLYIFACVRMIVT